MGRAYSRKSHENMTNIAPEAVEPIPDLLVFAGQVVPASGCTDGILTTRIPATCWLRACCDDGRPLPRWLHFDAGSRLSRQGAGDCRDHGAAHHRHRQRPGRPGGAQHFVARRRTSLNRVRGLSRALLRVAAPLPLLPAGQQ